MKQSGDRLFQPEIGNRRVKFFGWFNRGFYSEELDPPFWRTIVLGSFVKLENEMSGELEKYLRANSDIIRILEIVRELDLKDSWLCAGTIRNFIWNQYHFDRTTDVDIVFFDEGISYEKTLEIENHLHFLYPEYKWELKNQVFMHVHSPNSLPYLSSKDAIEKFPERCTAVGVRLLKEGNMELFAPFGLEDIYQYRVRPTPHFLADENRMQLYKTRASKKNWDHKWPQMIISFEE